MTSERIATLQAMSWWVWDVYEVAWQSQFEELKAYVQTHGKIPDEAILVAGLGWIVNAWPIELGKNQRKTSLSLNTWTRSVLSN